MATASLFEHVGEYSDSRSSFSPQQFTQTHIQIGSSLLVISSLIIIIYIYTHHYIIYYITMFDGFLIVTLFHHETSPQKIPFQCSIFLMVKGTHSSTPTPADFSIFHGSFSAVKRRSASLPWAMKRPGSFFCGPLRLG